MYGTLNASVPSCTSCLLCGGVCGGLRGSGFGLAVFDGSELVRVALFGGPVGGDVPVYVRCPSLGDDGPAVRHNCALDRKQQTREVLPRSIVSDDSDDEGQVEKYRARIFICPCLDDRHCQGSFGLDLNIASVSPPLLAQTSFFSWQHRFMNTTCQHFQSKYLSMYGMLQVSNSSAAALNSSS